LREGGWEEECPQAAGKNPQEEIDRSITSIGWEEKTSLKEGEGK
jgi:hypothetical protein